MAQSKIHVGLEIGTSKTCMVVGEIRPDATATIIGIGEAPSAGVRKGEIHDPAMVRQCICDAWQLAQDHANVDILNVFLSVTGGHVVGADNAGSFRLPENEEVIDERHISHAREKAENMDIGSDQFILNQELSGYSIDGGTPTLHPLGLTGRTLDVNCHVMHGVKTRFQNSLLCARQVPLEVEDLVFAPLATAQFVLTRQQKVTGALLIDIGAGTTDFICYADGDIVASGCVPVGGNNINQDIISLSPERMSKQAAEVLKCTEGNAMGDQKDGSYAQYTERLGMHDARIPRGVLNRIIFERLADTLVIVRNRIPAEIWKRHGMSVYLSGGTSMMRGLDTLAERVFGVRVYQPASLPAGEKHSYLLDPRYCTAIGLIRYAQRFDDDVTRKSQAGVFGRMMNFFKRGR